jgi:hypothetical protein
MESVAVARRASSCLPRCKPPGWHHRELPESHRSRSIAPSAKAMIESYLHANILHMHSALSPQTNLLARRTEVPLVPSPHGVLLPRSMGESTIRKQVYRRLIELPAFDGTPSAVTTSPSTSQSSPDPQMRASSSKAQDG